MVVPKLGWVGICGTFPLPAESEHWGGGGGGEVPEMHIKISQ